MEAFSLLKFWRNAAGGGGATTSQPPAVETDDEADDEGSFIDLEFTVPDCDDKEVDNDRDGDNNSLDNDDEDQYNDSAKRDGDTKLKDLFFKARIQPIEPSSKPQSPISLLRSAPKFRVFMLGFKKSKSEKTETNGGVSMATTPKHQHPKTTPHQQQGKLFTVKFKVESEAPIVSMFTRNNSSRSNNCKLHNQSSDDASSDDSSKRFPKDVVQKYLKLIKPLYVRVSKRYGEKMRFSGQLSTATSFPSPTKGSVCSPKKPIKTTSKREEGEDKQGNLPAGLRVVCKHLGKSRSASSAVGVFPPPASRRDDSLLQQHDGIQSAILHCKRSFNSSRESTLFSRSSSEEERGTSS